MSALSLLTRWRLLLLVFLSLMSFSHHQHHHRWRSGLTSAFVVNVAPRYHDCCKKPHADHQVASSPLVSTPRTAPTHQPTTRPLTLCIMMAERNTNNNKKSTKSGLEERVKNKLVKESIAPWRPLRLFLYFALGSGAFIGGLVTLSGTLAAISGVRTDVDINAEYVNLAIDFGAVAAFALLAKFDLDKQTELDQRVDERIEQKKEQKKLIQQVKEREKMLNTLPVEIRVSQAGDTRSATVQEVQAGARQHMIIVAGPKKACRDALVGANLLKMDFAMSNVLVVPYETDVDPSEIVSRPTGFGERPMYETQPYVARPTGDVEAWKEYINAEMKDAIQQNGIKAKEEGIAIVISNTGKVLRRGVGKVPWRQMVEELESSSKVA